MFTSGLPSLWVLMPNDLRWCSRRSNQSMLKEISPGCSLGRTDFEAETLILWPPDVKSWLIGKDPDAGKDWRQEEKGMTEDEMVGWHHLLNGHKFEQAPGDSGGQRSLACCRPWGCKESDTTEWLNWLSTWIMKDLVYYSSAHLKIVKLTLFKSRNYMFEICLR